MERQIVKITDSKTAPPMPDKAVARPSAQNAAASGSAAGEPIRLSAMSSELSALETELSASPAFDANKVASIKQAIQEGRFVINSGAIAGKLLSSVQEFLKEPH